MKKEKKPKPITEFNTVYALYAPEIIKLNAGDFKYVVMDFSLTLPEHIIGTFLIIPSLTIEGLKLSNYSFPQYGGKVRFELFNQNHTKKRGIKKRDKLAMFMTINEGTEHFQTRYETFRQSNPMTC